MTAFPDAATTIIAVFLLKPHCASARLRSSCSSGSRHSTLNAKASGGVGAGMKTDIEAFKATQTAVATGTVVSQQRSIKDSAESVSLKKGKVVHVPTTLK